MKRYVVKIQNEVGIYHRNDTYFIQLNIKDTLTNAASTPTDVEISITDPCGNELLSEVTMENPSNGVYSYEYSIPTDAPYGIYNVDVITLNYNTKTLFNFVLFPWDVVTRVRELSGAYQQNDISDNRLAVIAWGAYLETLNTLYELQANEKLTCACFDGDETLFTLSKIPIANRRDVDCDIDVYFRWVDVNDNYYDGLATVLDYNTGSVKLTKSDGNPVSSGSKGYITYWIRSTDYDNDLMREAVAYLTAHKVLIALQNLGKATLADLQSNEQKIRIDMNRFLKRYEEIVSQIGIPAIGCGK